MHKITLSDGRVLENLELNGNNYISSTIIDDEIFKDNLNNVSIDDGENVVEHTNMKLVQNKVYGTESWFILAEKTTTELEKERLEEELRQAKQRNVDTMIALTEMYETIAGGSI